MLAGDRDEAHAWQLRLERDYRPDLCIIDIAGIDAPDALRKGAPPVQGAAAWICRGTQCLPAMTMLADVEEALASPSRA